MTSTALVPIADMERMAVAFSKSGMFGAKTTDQVMALLLIAQAEGAHPAIAMRDFDVIQGRPAKKAEAMLRSFLAAGGKVEWHKLDDDGADATFSHPHGGTARISWDAARAKRAGLSGRDMYAKYARPMYRSRVVSEGVRTVYPAATSGLYVPEEVRVMARDQKREEKDITLEASHDVSDVDITLEIGKESAAPQASPTATQGQPSSSDRPAEAADPFITPDQVVRLEELLTPGKREKLLLNVSKQYGAKVSRLAQIKAADFDDALAYAEAK